MSVNDLATQSYQKFIPLGIPRDISERMIRLHGNPNVWWIGQFMKYLFRYKPETQAMLDEAKETANFIKPIVGVHVRRTDKSIEAEYNSIEEYMLHVADFFDKLELKRKVDVRRVYLASEDPSILVEARKKYPSYEFFGNQTNAIVAGLNDRFSEASLQSFLVDTHMLAHSDHLVCTFSSNVCRLAYEIMQTLHPDASAKINSLDDIYQYRKSSQLQQVAIYSHKGGSGQIAFEVGDILGYDENHWDGFSRGVNLRTKQSGLYPSIKVAEKYNIIDYPSYTDVDNNQ